MSTTTASTTAASSEHREGDRCPHHEVPSACGACTTPTKAYNIGDEYQLATADLDDFDHRTPAVLADERIPPTAIPCPPWCTLTPGHGFDSYEAALGVPCRLHEQKFDSPEDSWGVVIGCFENLDGTGLTVTTPYIEVFEPKANQATPAQARAMAAALGRAADRLAQILTSDVA